MSWIVFALLTPLFFSVTNFIEKYLVEKKIKDAMTITLLLGLSYALLGFIILTTLSFPSLSRGDTAVVLLSGVLLVLYLIPYFKALETDDASRVVPLFQTVPVLVLILSYFFLHEIPTTRQLFGFVVIVLSGFALGSENFSGGIFKPRKAFWYVMLSSMLYAFIGILFKVALKAQDFWIVLAYQMIGAGVGALLLLFYNTYRNNFLKEIKKINRKTWGILGINLTFSALGNICYAYAITLAPVALVTVVGGIQPLYVLVGGFLLSRIAPHIIQEDIRKETIWLKAVCIVVIFCGLYLIYL